MSALLTAVLTALSQLFPLIDAGSSGTLDVIIKAVVQIVPVAIQEAQDVVPLIQSLITEISSNAAITPAQVATLATVSAQIDAAFESAAKDDEV